jgi:hypothetical protein
MDVLQSGHAKDGDEAEADLDEDGILRDGVCLIDTALGNDAAILGELVERGRQLVAALVDDAVQPVKLAVRCSCLDGGLEVSDDALLEAGDIGIVVRDERGGVQLVRDEAHLYGAAGQFCYRVVHQFQALGGDGFFAAVDDGVHRRQNQGQVGNAHVVDVIDTGLDFVGTLKGGANDPILVPADRDHRAEADECRSCQRSQPLTYREALVHRHICHVKAIPLRDATRLCSRSQTDNREQVSSQASCRLNGKRSIRCQI